MKNGGKKSGGNENCEDGEKDGGTKDGARGIGIGKMDEESGGTVTEMIGVDGEGMNGEGMMIGVDVKKRQVVVGVEIEGRNV